MGWKTLDMLDLNGKVVLVRVDINVPMENGRVTDATRIEKIVPTVADIVSKGGKPVLLAHFGRPKGTVVPDMSLRQVLPALRAALPGRKIIFAEDCIGAPAKQAISSMQGGDIVLLENTRFHAGEEKNDPMLSAALAALGEVYVNDAFSAAHRAHASTEGIARLLPHGAGRLMEAELKALEAALGKPQRPVGAVVGGAKVSTKIDLLQNLVTRLDILIIGGGMANTFLAAQGAELGKSLQEADLHETARSILEAAKAAGCRVLLPVDGKVARTFAAGAEFETVALNAGTRLTADQMVLDAGDETVTQISDAFASLRTLIWNGPLGAFEMPPFDEATMAAARRAAELTDAGKLVTVAGGGDTVAALNLAQVADRFTYISTAGGAFLEWMEGKTLPGVAALET
jgi:phosphoglycerate kinase